MSDFEIIEATEKAESRYGENLYGNFVYFVNKEDIEALLNGKELASSINNEYAIFIRIARDSDANEETEEQIKINKDLQKAIDKITNVLREYKKNCEDKLNFEKDIHSSTARHNETYWKYCIDKLNYMLSILQGEEVK